MTTQTGFNQDTLGSYIDKDPAAILVYSLDWNDWIENNDAVANSVMTVSTISGDPNAMTIKSSGFTGNVTYAELQNGSAGNVYTVTNTITTADGAKDARRFRVKVQNRYA
jgi:hypothetical protein